MSDHFKEILKDVFASVIGSASCVYTGQPFDTIKVRMQVHPGEFTGPFQCFKTTIFTEGITALWRGSLPAFIGAVSENAVAFAVNEELKRLFRTYTIPIPTSSQQFFCGSVTGFFTAFVLCPSDVLKCRAQLSRATGGSGNFTEVFLQTFRTQGIGGFYTGITAQVMRDIPFYCFFFGSYDLACKYFKNHTQIPDSAVYFVSGGIAGQVAWSVSMPIDAVKSVVQTSAKPVTVMETVRTIYKTRGLWGFYRGIGVAVVRAFPANAALFVGYEFTRKAIS